MNVHMYMAGLSHGHMPFKDEREQSHVTCHMTKPMHATYHMTDKVHRKYHKNIVKS